MSSSGTIEAPCVLCYKVPKEVHSYCRPCWNGYQKWRYAQRRAGQPHTLKEYRIAQDLPIRTGIPVVDDPSVIDTNKEGARLKECPICHAPHRNPHSRAYCPPCKSAYSQYARRTTAAGRRPTMEEFRMSVEFGHIRPRHNSGHQGRVVRGI